MVVGLSLISPLIGIIRPLFLKPPSPLSALPALVSVFAWLRFCTPSFSLLYISVASVMLPREDRRLVLLQIQKHPKTRNGFESAHPPPAIVSAAPPTRIWKATLKKGDFWYFPTKSFFASAGLRLVCCYGDAAASGGTAVTPLMHPDLLIGRRERPRCARPGWRRSRHGRRRLAFQLSEVTDSPHLPSWHVAFSKQQERGGGWVCGGQDTQNTCVMINLKSGCLVGSWRVRVWVCVRSSDHLFLKPAEPLWNIDWAWLWCRTVKAPLMWANMWTRSPLKVFLFLPALNALQPCELMPTTTLLSVLFLFCPKSLMEKFLVCPFCSVFFCVLLSAFLVWKITGESFLVAAC